jgi:UDP-N-acetylglucosamine--N-acetylmuramyl-(pentapeptide) pyrophosphoryl-undecaprenol N-acetylglucosamine transferase
LRRFGGYVSGPVLQEAVALGIPSCIHEQNAYPGITNKTLAKSVDAVMLTVEDAKKHIDCKNPPVVTGLPVRGEIMRADKAVSRAGSALTMKSRLCFHSAAPSAQSL